MSETSSDRESHPSLAETEPSASGQDSGDAGLEIRPLGEELLGMKLHDVELGELIGTGGMGSVYRGHDQALDRPVAVKVLRAATLAAQDPKRRDRFLREARSQARLSHANVVQIHSVGEEDDLYYFVLELVDGESLEELLDRGERLEWQRALDLMIDVAQALKAAQERGIIHRDIKPSNLLVDREGVVKVADFGLAKWLDRGPRLTDDGAVLGTPLYMSPEQGQGEPVDHRSDIYSLGVTFYHLITGALPFPAKTPLAILARQLTEPVPPIRDAAPEVPESLARLVERHMLAADADERFQTYGELIDSLEAARPRPTTPAGYWVRAAAALVDVGVLAPLIAAILFAVWSWDPDAEGLLTLGFLGPLAAYQVVSWWRYGQTLGKWLFRLEVRTSRGERPSLQRCALRFVTINLWIWSLDLYSTGFWLVTDVWGFELPWGHDLSKDFNIGVMIVICLVASTFAMAGFRKDRRALHDLLSGTQVIYKV